LLLFKKHSTTTFIICLCKQINVTYKSAIACFHHGVFFHATTPPVAAPSELYWLCRETLTHTRRMLKNSY